MTKKINFKEIEFVSENSTFGTQLCCRTVDGEVLGSFIGNPETVDKVVDILNNLTLTAVSLENVNARLREENANLNIKVDDLSNANDEIDPELVSQIISNYADDMRKEVFDVFDKYINQENASVESRILYKIDRIKCLNYCRACRILGWTKAQCNGSVDYDVSWFLRQMNFSWNKLASEKDDFYLNYIGVDGPLYDSSVKRVSSGRKKGLAKLVEEYLPVIKDLCEKNESLLDIKRSLDNERIDIPFLWAVCTLHNIDFYIKDPSKKVIFKPNVVYKPKISNYEIFTNMGGSDYVESCREQGMTDEAIALGMGICSSSLSDYMGGKI